jgi:Acetyltransferase (GNAT) domain
VLRSRTARVTVYVSDGDRVFVSQLLNELGALGARRARLSDPVHGLPSHILEQAGITPIVSHRLTHARALSDRELFERLTPRRRTAIERAEREGVVVDEIREEAEIEQYCSLPPTDMGVGNAVMPVMASFAIRRAMVPKRQAVFFLARRDDRPIAGALYLVSSSRMSCFHEVSTREPELLRLQGMTSVIWHALRVAHRRGLANFDLGAVTPTKISSHPDFHAYQFKREFGGHLETVHHGEVKLPRRTYALPAFLRSARGREPRVAAAFG